MNELELTPDQMIDFIERGECFAAVASDDSFRLAIHEYFPYVGTAIYHGSQIRGPLLAAIRLDKPTRWSRESPGTGAFVASFPIHLIANDSLFEYDLDQPPESAVLQGEQWWQRPLDEETCAVSQAKHAAFYKVLDTLLSVLQEKFGACLVFDVRAMNWRNREDGGSLPLIRLSAAGGSGRKWSSYIEKCHTALQAVALPPKATTITLDAEPSQGYLAHHLTTRHKKTLLITLRVKKVYCHEETGDVFPEVIHDLRTELKQAILLTTDFFTNKATRLKVKTHHALLRSQVSEVVAQIDAEIFKLHKSLEMLPYINPINIEAERRKFVSRTTLKPPRFHYKPLSYDPGRLKRRLYQLPLEKITDAGLYRFYRDIIDNTARQLDLLQARQTPNFVYYSLILYGEPEARDIDNARYILHCADQQEDEELFGDKEAVEVMKATITDYGFKGRVEIVQNLAARATVLNATRVCKIRKGEHFTMSEIQALAHHEIGVHMVSNVNATMQPLSFPRLGLPRYNETQEGLALLSELLSGNLGMKRLKQLAYRVLAVKSMLQGHDFIGTFQLLTDTYGMAADPAFYMTTRVFRGGGFTKDYLYLRGLQRIYTFYRKGGDLETLLLGKISLDYYDMLLELRQRNILVAPQYVTHSFLNPKPVDPVLDFVLDGLR